MKIYYNDKLTETGSMEFMCHGFQFGYGVFETILVKEGLPCFIDKHYERLLKACSRLGLELKTDINTIFAQASKLAEMQNITDGRLKIICFRDLNIDSTLVTLSEYHSEAIHIEKGISIQTSSIKRNPFSPFCYIKSLNYAENIIAKAEAKSQGYDEALFLNVNNQVCEGAVSNIFWIKGDIVHTPELSCGLLDGITRNQVIDICSKLGYNLLKGKYALPEIMQADEVFVTNSLLGIMPVHKVDNIFYNISDYKVTYKIKEEYLRLIGTGFNVNTSNK